MYLLIVGQNKLLHQFPYGNIERGKAQARTYFDDLNVRIDANFIQTIPSMNRTRRQTSFVTMKMPPDIGRQSIDVGGTHINVAGIPRCSLQLCQERHNIHNWVEYMAANHYIRLQVIGSIL